MKLVYIMSMPSSGTKATAGTLKNNGFWVSGHTSSFECEEAYSVLWTRYGKKASDELPDKERGPSALKAAKKIFDDYKIDAANAGFDKCFMKSTWMPLWCPEIFLDCGVSPLLVWRDPDECALSLSNRGDLMGLTKGRKSSEIIAQCRMGHARIEWLHQRYDWPIWRFGKEAKISDLEAAVGESLPVKFFDPAIIKTEMRSD